MKLSLLKISVKEINENFILTYPLSHSLQDASSPYQAPFALSCLPSLAWISHLAAVVQPPQRTGTRYLRRREPNDCGEEV